MCAGDRSVHTTDRHPPTAVRHSSRWSPTTGDEPRQGDDGVSEGAECSEVDHCTRVHCREAARSEAEEHHVERQPRQRDCGSDRFGNARTGERRQHDVTSTGETVVRLETAPQWQEDAGDSVERYGYPPVLSEEGCMWDASGNDT